MTTLCDDCETAYLNNCECEEPCTHKFYYDEGHKQGRIDALREAFDRTYDKAYDSGYQQGLKYRRMIEESSEPMKSNADKLGVDTAKLQLIEECGELIQAVCKYNRTLGIGQKTEVSQKDALNNLIEELADVTICIEQLCYLMDLNDDVQEKIDKAIEKVAKRYADQ